jgi:hypothetical protein
MFIGKRDDTETEFHESIHIEQQLNKYGNDNGWLGFYGQLIGEYIQHGFGEGFMEMYAYAYGNYMFNRYNNY